MAPGAWELEHKGPRVCVSIPILGMTVSINWARALRQMQWPDGTDSYIITGLPWGPARNKCVEHVLANNYSHILYMDVDTVPPADGLLKLLDHNLDIVSGLYYTKFEPVRPVAYKAGIDPEGNPIKLPLPPFQLGDLLEVDYVGMGFCLIHRRVFEAMPPPWYEWTLDVHQPRGASEDFEWCHKARGLGFHIHLATRVQCEHELRAITSYRGLEVELL